MYYLQNLTHQEIANQLNLSRVKITRLLQEAVKNKIVEFKIKDPYLEILELEDKFKQTFHLKQVIITPSPLNEDELFTELGGYTADFLMQNLKHNLVIGIGWGRTLNGMVPALSPSPHKNIHVVSLTGGLSANENQPNPYDIASAVAKQIGATPHYLLIPLIFENETSKNLLLKDKTIQKTMEWWDKIDVALMSIGVPSAETGVFYALPKPQKEVAQAKKQGAIGDLLAHLFDQQGNFLRSEFTQRMVAIEFAQLKKIPLVVGVAGGNTKTLSILGALRTGILNVLITDEQTAQKIIKLQIKPSQGY